jgi:hypothetical protein
VHPFKVVGKENVKTALASDGQGIKKLTLFQKYKKRVEKFADAIKAAADTDVELASLLTSIAHQRQPVLK